MKGAEEIERKTGQKGEDHSWTVIDAVMAKPDEAR